METLLISTVEQDQGTNMLVLSKGKAKEDTSLLSISQRVYGSSLFHSSGVYLDSTHDTIQKNSLADSDELGTIIGQRELLANFPETSGLPRSVLRLADGKCLLAVGGSSELQIYGLSTTGRRPMKARIGVEGQVQAMSQWQRMDKHTAVIASILNSSDDTYIVLSVLTNLSEKLSVVSKVLFSTDPSEETVIEADRLAKTLRSKKGPDVSAPRVFLYQEAPWKLGLFYCMRGVFGEFRLDLTVLAQKGVLIGRDKWSFHLVEFLRFHYPQLKGQYTIMDLMPFTREQGFEVTALYQGTRESGEIGIATQTIEYCQDRGPKLKLLNKVRREEVAPGQLITGQLLRDQIDKTYILLKSGDVTSIRYPLRVETQRIFANPEPTSFDDAFSTNIEFKEMLSDKELRILRDGTNSMYVLGVQSNATKNFETLKEYVESGDKKSRQDQDFMRRNRENFMKRSEAETTDLLVNGFHKYLRGQLWELIDISTLEIETVERIAKREIEKMAFENTSTWQLLSYNGQKKELGLPNRPQDDMITFELSRARKEVWAYRKFLAVWNLLESKEIVRKLEETSEMLQVSIAVRELELQKPPGNLKAFLECGYERLSKEERSIIGTRELSAMMMVYRRPRVLIRILEELGSLVLDEECEKNEATIGEYCSLLLMVLARAQANQGEETKITSLKRNRSADWWTKTPALLYTISTFLKKYVGLPWETSSRGVRGKLLDLQHVLLVELHESSSSSAFSNFQADYEWHGESYMNEVPVLRCKEIVRELGCPYLFSRMTLRRLLSTSPKDRDAFSQFKPTLDSLDDKKLNQYFDYLIEDQRFSTEIVGDGNSEAMEALWRNRKKMVSEFKDIQGSGSGKLLDRLFERMSLSSRHNEVWLLQLALGVPAQVSNKIEEERVFGSSGRNQGLASCFLAMERIKQSKPT
jgi:hypothetical protein